MNFWHSRHFGWSLAVAVLLSGTIVAGPLVAPGMFDSIHTDPCDMPEGKRIAPSERETTANGRRETFGHATATNLRVCIVVGSIHFETHNGNGIEIVAAIRERDSGLHDVVADTRLSATLDENTFVVHETRHGQASSWVGSSHESTVSLTIRLPTRELGISAGVSEGRITGVIPNATGMHSLGVGVGDLDVRIAALGSGSLHASVSVGSLELRLPTGPAYNVRALATVGSVHIGLAGFDLDDRSTTPPGEDVSGHTTGAYPVTLRASTSVGDVTING